MEGGSPLFDRFSPLAKVFYSGSLCTAEEPVKSDGVESTRAALRATSGINTLCRGQQTPGGA